MPHPPAKAPTACESNGRLGEHRHGNAMTYSSLALIGGNPMAPASALFRSAKLAVEPASLPRALQLLGHIPISTWPSNEVTLYDWRVRMQMTRLIRASSAVVSLPPLPPLLCFFSGLPSRIASIWERKFGHLFSGQEVVWINPVWLSTAPHPASIDSFASSRV